MLEVYLLASTKLRSGWYEFIYNLGHSDWVDPETADPDLLCETAGRLCYKSWAAYEEGDLDLNANIVKIREGNKEYLYNIIKSGHGSVLEHVNFTFLFRGCSRVLTHELVRHRAGCAYSQESLRYCKLEHLQIVIPDESLPSTISDGKVNEAREIMQVVTNKIRLAVAELNKLLLDSAHSFVDKKQITSYIRRIAPIGVKTNILFTVNARALRHLIQQRTSRHAEVEIRQAFFDVANLVKDEAPNIFQDMTQNGTECVFEFPKV